MNDKTYPIAVRAFPVMDSNPKPPNANSSKKRARRNREPSTALIFDCETRTDISLRLTVGFAVELRSNWRTGLHVVEKVICFVDESALSTPERLTVEESVNSLVSTKISFLDSHLQYITIPDDLPIEYQTIESFRETFYRVGNDQRGAVVGFNLPFDISRLAVRSSPGRRDKIAHAFTLISKTDSRGRNSAKVRHPRISIKPIDGRRAIIRFSGSKKTDGYFIDLKTLGDALTGSRHSLESACKTFNVQHKKEHDHSDGLVTRALMNYGLNDALISAELYIAEMNEFRLHPIEKTANQIYSEASIGKEYLKKMGLRLPNIQVSPDLDLHYSHHPVWEKLPSIDPVHAVQGFATSTYFGGRTECRIRKSIVPVTYVDFLSMYPTCNTLMGLWGYLTAETILAEDATNETQEFLDRISSDNLFDPITWKHLNVIVELNPDGDILPTRTKYGDEVYSAYSIGVNPLISNKPMWWTLADCIASRLRTGRSPRINRAIKFTPKGKQKLQTMTLRGQVTINPNTQDFFRDCIIERREVRNPNGKYAHLTDNESERLQKFIKILINATSYGIYMEMNRQDGEEALVHAHGVRVISGKVAGPEKLGDYCFPILSTLITGAARLMLELASHEVRKQGGTYVFMDTDSLAIIVTRDGGIITSADTKGMEYFALSHAQVSDILDSFRKLNPYGDDASILQRESENYAIGDGEEQLYVYSIASKRYVLLNIDKHGKPIMRKNSEHGLGAYRIPVDPESRKSVADWEKILWRVLVTRELTGELILPEWAGQTALTSIRVSTREHMKWFSQFNTDTKGNKLPYEDSVKPFNFMVHPLINSVTQHSGVCLVAPMGSNAGYINRHAPRDARYFENIHFKPKTYRDVILEYDRHPERKFADGDGYSCTSTTRGQLFDQPVAVGKIVHIGKEGNSLEESRADLHSEPERQLEYGDSEYQDFLTKLRDIPTKELAKLTGYNERTIRRIKNGEMTPTLLKLLQLAVQDPSMTRLRP